MLLHAQFHQAEVQHCICIVLRDSLQLTEIFGGSGIWREMVFYKKRKPELETRCRPLVGAEDTSAVILFPSCYLISGYLIERLRSAFVGLCRSAFLFSQPSISTLMSSGFRYNTSCIQVTTSHHQFLYIKKILDSGTINLQYSIALYFIAIPSYLDSFRGLQFLLLLLQGSASTFASSTQNGTYQCATPCQPPVLQVQCPL